MHKTKSRIVISSATVLLVAVLSTGSSFAAAPSGWGDAAAFNQQIQKNNLEFHKKLTADIQQQIHLGPPGSSVRPEDLHNQILLLNRQLRNDIQTYVTQLRSLISSFVSSIHA